MTRHRAIVLSVRILSWNLFHGRDAPPEPSLTTWRSRLLGATETGATHAQVNRPLLREFGTVLDRDPWHVALLQEAPPRWLRPLCERTGASGASALTARNAGARVRAWLADRNPDLMASAEGGSNQLLVRPPWRIVDVRRMTLTRRPERRRMLWARLEDGHGGTLCVATLHATAHDERDASRDVVRAAEHASLWAGGHPLVLGGDFNLRPGTSPQVFRLLRRQFGLAGRTSPGAIDHILARELERRGRPRRLPARWRELPGPAGLALRLSDHDAVALELVDPPDPLGRDGGPGGEPRPGARPAGR